MVDDFKALEWTGRSLKVLDQTGLPDRFAYLEEVTYGEVLDDIRNLRVRGAPNIGIAGAYAMVLALQKRPGKNTLREAYDRITGTRPTAVNLRRACDIVRASVERTLGRPNPNAASDMVLAAEAAAQGYEALETTASDRLTTHGASHFNKRGFRNFMTICNTGKLAAPGYGTALGCITRLPDKLGAYVWALETRPLLQGLRLTGWELSKMNHPHSVIVDSAAASILANTGPACVDCVVVGADRIAANGDVANKIGTRTLAELANTFDVPFYVAAPSTTFDPDMAQGRNIPIEHRDAYELCHGHIATPNNIGLQNPAFDITPFYHVNGYITERGVFGSAEAALELLPAA